eukprot:TRINITY_DN800_c0_g1_i1.p1 TRINITY_DN800_c0_g1~~TRINITY_DN800_c0_g1_i1.p1  ORF type:complete len:234 (+),score=59.09 TRINITY_DN800_c0_g1_i1:113-814(+)
MSTPEAQAVVDKMDQLHKEDKYMDLYRYGLEEWNKPQFQNIAEIAWRLTRAHFDAAERAKDNNEKKSIIMKGVEIGKKSLELGPDNFACHKWYAIVLSLAGDFISTKEKIGNAFVIKEHAMKANELKPNDSTTLHLLGRWCFDVSKIGWMERKLAATLFASPPESSYDEALKYFLAAQEAEPNFIRNAVCIGDTYTLLKNVDKANEWYLKATKIPTENEFDKERQAEAKRKII